MKQSEKLFEAVTNIRDDIVEDATTHKFRGKRRKFRRWAVPIAAVLAIAIAVTSITWPSSPAIVRARALAEAEYPEMAPYPDDSEQYDADAFDAWYDSLRAQRRPAGYSDGLDGFWANSVRLLLSEPDGKNKVCSPVNLYLALCMLAETTQGNSRQQILAALGADSVEALRQQANDLWNANYLDDGATTCVLANSLWVDETISVHQETADLLAEHYYASSYQGDLGSPEMDTALRNWLNQQTGNLLSDQINNLSLDPLTVFALASTLHYRVRWSSEFNPDYTKDGVFHGVNGDTTAEFMTKSPDDTYYWGNSFSAISMYPESISGRVWFILPDEGVTPEELLQDDQVMELISSNGANGEQKRVIIHMSIPKFDISAQFDLTGCMTGLGITDVFDPAAADFSPITNTLDPTALSQPTHGVRVAIDEEGVTAAAYTVLPSAGAAPPPDDEVDFVLDRPFLFVITGADGVPLFVGIVNQI